MSKFIGLDVTLFYFINQSLENKFFNLIMPIITNIKYWRIPLLIMFGCLFFWGKKEGKKTFIICVVALILSDQISSSLLKPLFHRLRPFKVLDDVHLLVNAHGFSLPSSHASNVCAIAMVITHIWRRFWIGFCSFFIAFTVSFSRVYVGVHYPLDIFAGFLVGILSAILAMQIFKGFKWLVLKYREKRAIN